MAKIQIKSEKLTPFGGFFSIMEQFDALLAQTIDSTLGLRCTLFGYQYSEILRFLMCVYLCGGSCIEDIPTHLTKHLSLHPTKTSRFAYFQMILQYGFAYFRIFYGNKFSYFQHYSYLCTA